MTSTRDTQGAPHDLVVIGASAGGVETLREVVRGLPSDLEATVCVVLHIAPTSPSALAHILERAARIPCRTAVDGEPLVAGEILVAPPDHHLVIEDGHARLSAGPRENGHRPSVDTLFRSAAGARDGRVVGVILSGTRDDGTLGLALIQANGGLTVVQDPQEAMYAGMPSSALSQVDVDAVVPSTRVAEVITAMVRGEPLPPGVDPPGRGEDGSPERVNRFTTICPECGGVLSERVEAGIPQWECRVGHRYSPESLMAAQARDVEMAMWAAVRALEDRRMLLERMAEQMRQRGQSRSERNFTRRAREAETQAGAVRAALLQAAEGSLHDAEAALGASDAEQPQSNGGGEG